jgi:hypothetical protein
VEDRALAQDPAPLAVDRSAPISGGPPRRWRPISADGIELFNLEKAGITRYRYRYRGAAITNPWTTRNDSDRGEPVASRGARRVR